MSDEQRSTPTQWAVSADEDGVVTLYLEAQMLTEAGVDFEVHRIWMGAVDASAIGLSLLRAASEADSTIEGAL